MKSADYLFYYSTKFDMIEVDSTFYGTPTLKTAQSWYSKTSADLDGQQWEKYEKEKSEKSKGNQFNSQHTGSH
jgi:hypothetical protein